MTKSKTLLHIGDHKKPLEIPKPINHHINSTLSFFKQGVRNAQLISALLTCLVYTQHLTNDDKFCQFTVTQ